MAIRIEKIEINGCGPIKGFSEKIAPCTVIFAGNEKGKTTIVENIVASLFHRQRNSELPSLRDTDFIGASRITVSGIPGGTRDFIPLDKKNRLDNIIENDGKTLPRGLYNLLVVRGAEMRISKESYGFSRSVLKNLISKQRVYDQVKEKLPGELKYTRIENGRLDGDNKGKNKEYNQLLEKYRELQALSDEYHSLLSRTRLVQLEKERKKLYREQDTMLRAKRYYASSLSLESENLQKELASTSGDMIEASEEKTREFNRLASEKKMLEKTLSSTAGISENLAWLREARELYERYLSQTGNPLQAGFLIASAVSLGVSLGMFFYMPVYTYIPLSLSFMFLILALLFTFVVKKTRTGESAQAGIRHIKEDFFKRFGKRLNSRVDIETALNEMEKKNWEIENNEKLLHEAGISLGRLESELDTLYAGVGISGKGDRLSTLQALKRGRNEKEKRRAEIQGILRNLAVDPSDYLIEDPGVKYSRNSEDRCAGRIREIENEIVREREKFENTVRKLTDHIESDIAHSNDIEKISLALAVKLDEYLDKASSNYATMVAGHLVKDVILDFQAEEDERLTGYLNSSDMTSLLAGITGHYHGFSVEGEDVYVVSNRGTYNIRDLSTGARDQIMLILRTGIARAITGSESMFLVLDDAFQYSDWDRRDRLIHEVMSMVNEGWQVIYLTMDNDIRDRFNKAGRSLPDGVYRYIEL